MGMLRWEKDETVAVLLMDNVELGFHVDGYGKTVNTSYRDFTWDDGGEIDQTLRLTIVPSGVTLRLVPTSKRTKFAPYVGGGVDLRGGGLLQNCEVYANRGDNGGGVSLTQGGGMVENCTIRDNDSTSGRGGGMWVYQGGLVRNSSITGNRARWGGGVCLEYSGTLMNCTVAGNTATERGGGVRCQYGGAITNSIVYYNVAPKDPNIEDDRGVFSHVCTVPDPGGIGNITALPGLVSRSNPHLVQPTMPAESKGRRCMPLSGVIGLHSRFSRPAPSRLPRCARGSLVPSNDDAGRAFTL